MPHSGVPAIFMNSVYAFVVLYVQCMPWLYAFVVLQYACGTMPLLYFIKHVHTSTGIIRKKLKSQESIPEQRYRSSFWGHQSHWICHSVSLVYLSREGS